MSRKLVFSLASLAMIGTAVLISNQGNLGSLRSDYFNDEGELIKEYDQGAAVMCLAEYTALNNLTAELTKTQADYALLNGQKTALQARKKILEIKNTKDANYVSSIAYIAAAIVTKEKTIKTANDTFYKATKFKTIAEWEAEREKQRALKISLPEDLTTLQSELATLQSELTSLKAELTALTKIKPQTTQTKTDITAKNAEIKAKNIAISAKNTAIANKKKEITTNTARLKTLEWYQPQAARANMDSRSAQNDIDELTKRRDILADELIQIIGDLEKIATFYTTIETLTAQIAAAQIALDKCNVASDTWSMTAWGDTTEDDQVGWDGTDGSKYPACYTDSGALNCGGWVGLTCCTKVAACATSPVCQEGGGDTYASECFDQSLLEELNRARWEASGLLKLKFDIENNNSLDQGHKDSETQWIDAMIENNNQIIKDILARRAAFGCPNV